MLDSGSSIPNFRLQTPAVDFIDNHLPRHHPFFANPPARYDPHSGHYVDVPVRDRAAMSEANARPATDPAPPAADAIMTRPPDTSIDRMTFWDSRFTPSRAKFSLTVTPPEKREIKFDIRVDSNWDGIYEKLQLAKEQYLAERGFRGFLKRIRRKVADRWIEPIQGIIKFVPDIDYVTPVLGAVEIVLEAMKTSADARAESLAAFDDLRSTFSTVELFFVLWPHDDALKGASIDLIVATMTAIEVAIGFFIQPGWKKSSDAVLKSDTYGESLRSGLTGIKTCTEALLQQAEFSQMIDIRNAHIEAKKYFRKLDEYQKVLKKIHDEVSNTAKAVSEMDGKVSNTAETVDGLKESFHDFFEKYQRDKEKEEARLKEEDAKREERERKRENERQKEERQVQAERRRYQAELDAANSKIHQLEIEAVSRVPSPYQLPPYSPPPQPSRPQPVFYPYFSPEALWRLIDMPALEATDLSHILQKRLRVPSVDRARTELLPRRDKFAGWISSLKSTRLLIHGDFDPKPISALSVFCAVLLDALEGRSRIIRLVWFCGQHLKAHDRRSAGGVAMLRSFIAQLLCQQWVDTRWMLRDMPGFDQVRLGAGDIDQLLILFGWLVRHLPRDVTVFCIVDGLSFYERAEFLDDMSEVVACAARLSMDEDIDCTVKLLVTSPIPTKVVRDAFEDDDLILSMKGMTDFGPGTNFSALTRVAASESEDDTSSEESEESPYDSSEEESEDESHAGVSSDGSEYSVSDDDSISNTDTGSEDTTDSDGDSTSDQYS